jgi:hypothetical protein
MQKKNKTKRIDENKWKTNQISNYILIKYYDICWVIFLLNNFNKRVLV